ncbi:MAG: peroxiredoxin [Porticoccaceae bacterium]|jgi:peroxiredoxin|tara:strand:+ start:187 stop:663 length:477 start_codon:yes stop_codon:yes gene_type:complete
MTIKVGDKVPEGMMTVMGAEGPAGISTADIFDGKKVVLFAVPGAFTPTCSMAHLPGFVVHVDAIKAKGVDTVACMSVNDVFVMDAWGKAANAEHLVMLADGNGDFTKALDLVLDASVYGMGARSKRFAMVVDDGVVSLLNIDEAALEATSAEAILAAL